MKLIYAGNNYKISNGIFFEWMQILHKEDIFSFLPGDIHRYLLKAYTLQMKCSEKKKENLKLKTKLFRSTCKLLDERKIYMYIVHVKGMNEHNIQTACYF